PGSYTVARKAGHGELNTNMPAALLLPLLNLLNQARHFERSRMSIQRDRSPHFATEKIVDRHAGSLAHDVPQGAVHPAERIIAGNTASKIGLQIGRLPDVFDLVHVTAYDERLRVLLQ